MEIRVSALKKKKRNFNFIFHITKITKVTINIIKGLKFDDYYYKWKTYVIQVCIRYTKA